VTHSQLYYISVVQHKQQTVSHLAGVLAALHISGAEHGLCDHARVGVVTDLLGEDGDVHTLQTVTVGRCSNKQTNKETSKQTTWSLMQ